MVIPDRTVAASPFRHSLCWLALLAAPLTLGCTQPATEPAGAAATAQPAAPTNRIDINSLVRQNLGIDFAKVELRNVARTLRVPGRFELLPTARREYRVPVAGKIELLVKQYQQVEIGDPLYRLDSPRWRELQAELTDAVAKTRLAEAESESVAPLLAAYQARQTEIQNAVEIWTDRVETLVALQKEGTVRAGDLAEAKSALATARVDAAELLEKQAELQARQREVAAQLEAAQARQAILLETAGAFTGKPVAELSASAGDRPQWLQIQQLDVRALSAGVVDVVSAISGAYVDQNGPVLTTVEPESVCFRAHGLQSDLGTLNSGMAAAVVFPSESLLGAEERIPGTLIIAPTADADRRTIELVMYPSPQDDRQAFSQWTRAGMSAFLELVVAGTSGQELAIPLMCVARDGTQSIIFRRDPKDPDKAIRLEADLGIDDGRWVTIKSGVAEGDEIVANGVYQLMVATSGTITRGGHFHADGTFHEGNE